MNQYSHFQPNSKHLITEADLGKVYIDMQGQQRTINKQVVGECLVAYVVTNKWGKSEIVGILTNNGWPSLDHGWDIGHD